MTKVRINPRKKKRDRNNALGDNILRYITELVTNSDDSYKRLESNGIASGDGLIYIKLEKDRRNGGGFVISVTDHAEGMSAEKLNDTFSDYAGDNAGGTESGSRGIFGQGASDVLQAAAAEKKTAMIESIKDGSFSRLKYNIDENEDGEIDVKEIGTQGNQLKQLRDNLNIPNNGTKVSFGIPERVRFNNKIINNLPELIEAIPSLRYLLNQKNRRVIYVYEGNEKVLSSKRFLFNENDLIKKKDFTFMYENEQIRCHLALYKNENKKVDGTNIIVRDERYIVYDNTMFDFKNSIGVQNISGELIVENLYEICKKHLNRENPDAIVFDNRTGFNTKHEFYEELDKKMYPILDEIIKLQSKGERVTNLDNNKNISEALKKLNKYLKNELKDVIVTPPGATVKTPPVEGIRFARGNISITKGKKYDLKLFINANIIGLNETIDVLCENDSYVEISPNKINYSFNDIEDGLVTKNVTIKGLEITSEPIKVQAKIGTRISNVIIDVIEEDIHYPQNGMEFYPSEISLVADKQHLCKLYIDTDVIPIGSKIDIMCEGLEMEQNCIIVNNQTLINDTISCMDIISNGGKINETYEIKASYNDYNSNCKVTIIEQKKNGNNAGGYIAGIKTKPIKMFVQSYLEYSDRVMYINSLNPINIKMLDNLENINPDNPKFNKEQMRYLCDIIAMQTARYLVIEQTKNGDIDIEDPESAAEQILDLIQQHKNKIYVDIFPAMMGIAEDNKYEDR